MREMKDSGIEWIGKVPLSWSIIPVKYYFNIGRGRVISVLELEDDGQFPVYSSQTENNGCLGYINTYDYSGPSITWTTDGAKAGTVFYRDGKYNCTNVFGILTIKSNFTTQSSIKFMTYAIGMVSEQNKRKDINGYKIMSNEMANIRFAVPPLNEQIRIVNHLDYVCESINGITLYVQTELDRLEEIKQSIISEAVTKGLNRQVKTRESGIRWCPNIPVHWKTDRGKFILQLLERPVYEDDGVITCFRDGEVTLRSKRREDGFTVSLQEAGYQGIEPGDLVVHGMDGFAGAIGISDSRGKGTPVLNVMDSQQNKRYLMYYLRWIAKIGVFESLSTGIRVRSCDTNWNKLRELPYIVPPIEEQDAIAKYLDEKCAKIDEAIADKRKLLDILDNYKKSLIFEYVTGKKEVL